MKLEAVVTDARIQSGVAGRAHSGVLAPHE